MKANKNMAFAMTVEKVKYKKLKHLIKMSKTLADVEDIIKASAQLRNPGGREIDELLSQV